MTLATNTAALGLKDTKIYGYTAGAYSSTGIDVPKVTQVVWGPVVAGKELEGDDSVEQYSYVKNYEGKLAFQKISLEAMESVFGGTLTSSGETPNQKQTYTFPDVGSSMPQFKISGQCTKVDAGLGDAVVTLTGCKVKPGSYPITMQYDNYASIAIDVFIADKPTLVLNETETTLS